jgi:hypothetical protein
LEKKVEGEERGRQQEVRGGGVGDDTQRYTVLHSGGVDSLLPSDHEVKNENALCYQQLPYCLLGMSCLSTIQPGSIFTYVDR